MSIKTKSRPAEFDGVQFRWSVTEATAPELRLRVWRADDLVTPVVDLLGQPQGPAPITPRVVRQILKDTQRGRATAGWRKHPGEPESEA